MIYNGHQNGLIDLKDTVDQVVTALRSKKSKYDSIVVRGMSGVLVGAPVSLRLNKPLVVTRKPNENSHGFGVINAEQIGERWLFLDDFISTGITFRACQDAVSFTYSQCVARFLYRYMIWEDIYHG